MPQKKSKRSGAGKTSGSQRTLSDDKQRELEMLKTLRTSLVEKMEQEQVEFGNLMRKIDEEEKVAFQTACREYTEEQLNMTLVEFEMFLKLEVGQSSPAAASSNVSVSEGLRVRVKKTTGNKKVQTARSRRPSMVHQYAHSESVGRRSAPKATKTNVKNSKPRQARLGELAFSAHGSPILLSKLAKSRMTIHSVDIHEDTF